MKNLICFLCLTLFFNTADAQYAALRISNNTNCDYYVGIEMTDIYYPTCSDLFTTINAIPIAASSGSVVYLNIDIDNMGYAYGGLNIPVWDSDPSGGNTQIKRVKLHYDSALTGCVDAVIFGPCPGNGNGPISFSSGCSCNGGNAPTVTMSTVTNSPWNYTLISITP